MKGVIPQQKAQVSNKSYWKNPSLITSHLRLLKCFHKFFLLLRYQNKIRAVQICYHGIISSQRQDLSGMLAYGQKNLSNIHNFSG